MGRNLFEMGILNSPKTYQNKVIEGNDDFVTKELICEQYCLTQLPDPDVLFTFTKSKEWAEAEFQERIDPAAVNPGEAWKLRKEMWEEFLNQYGKFDYSYGERMHMFDSLEEVIALLKRDNDTRKAVLPIYDTSDQILLDGSGRIPCSMYYDFLIRMNAKGEKQLNICYHQRSSDFVAHFGNDVWLAWKLMEYVAEQVGVKPGYLYHTIDSLHSYKRDWIVLKSSLAQFI